LCELGKALKTTFLCDSLRLESLRREIQEGLQVIENWNSANDFILYGKGGEFTSNRREDREILMLCLHLLQVSLVYVNTLMIKQVLAEACWQGRLTAVVAAKVATHKPLWDIYFEPERASAAGTGDPDLRDYFAEIRASLG
jgi:TnpA family transposase